MIELNLLPDIKLQYINAQRTRRLIYSITVIVTTLAVALLIILLAVDVYQKKHISDLNNQINQNANRLKSEPQINKILTVQNQLSSLTQLHQSKPNVSQLFSYLNELTPTSVFINDFTIDFNAHTSTITGTADSLATVNQFIDTIKYTTYSASQSGTQTASNLPAFSNVVLSSFAPPSSTGNNASYSISLSFDPTIFDITKTVKLSVPSIQPTRAGIAQPSDLFQNAPPKSSGGNQ